MRSLKTTEAFRAFVLDQLADLGDVVPRAMFGGVGLYCNAAFFGLIAGDVLYLKVDDTNLADYERAGTHAFRPYANRAGSKHYYAVPLDVLESSPDLVTWARRAVAVAGRGTRTARRSHRR